MSKYVREKTIDICRMEGEAHRAYGWSPKPALIWTDEQINAYCDGYQSTPEGRERHLREAAEHRIRMQNW